MTNQNIIKELDIHTVVIGTGASGFNAADRLYQYGERNLAIITEGLTAGTSRNTGSDKQTYYKLSLAGPDEDSMLNLAQDLFSGQCVDGDLALCEAALSVQSFYKLAELGVPFPHSQYGEFVGYKTDHDRGRRATSAGPYTSKMMTEALERSVRSKGIEILDHLQVIRILTDHNSVSGLLCLDIGKKEELSFVLVWCSNVVYATGGPAGMYRDSVYPVSQFGSSGIAFEAGVKGKNLTEWQFGIASIRPRWNVSGTYMQVLPRFVSTDQNGKDEKEFLKEYYAKMESAESREDQEHSEHVVNKEKMLSDVFLKGYQWPFDMNKIFGGSSIIDLLVYQERILRGRRVFLDFRSNPDHQPVAFEKLSEEAYSYLKNAGACYGTPIERLAHMNEPAISFYLDHGVDLYQEMLEVAVCAQHNNGGLSVDCHWETNVHGFFAVGEAAGTHGVTRPGGSALNAGQVGALRAAEWIALHRDWDRDEVGENGGREGRDSVAEQGSRRHLFRELAKERIELALQTGDGGISPGEAWIKATSRMSSVGGMIRSLEELEKALYETDWELKNFSQYVSARDLPEVSLLYRLYDMLLSQKVYLSAMVDYIHHGGKSRGSALYHTDEGKKPDGKESDGELPALFKCCLDGGDLKEVVQEVELRGRTCECQWRKVREIPEVDYFFENQWKAYRERQPHSIAAFSRL